jgi:cytochrome P450
MSDRVNLLDPEVHANPYPVYARLRRTSPVCQVEPGGLWVAALYKDAALVLKNTEFFSSAGFAALLKPAWLGHNPVGDSMICMDPPSHTKLRALVSKAFNARGLARMELRIRGLANELADHLLTLGQADYITEFAHPLPSRLMSEVLGLDASLHRRFKQWARDLGAISPALPDPELAASIRETITEMDHYLREAVEARRREPGDDVVSDLVRAKVDGVALTDDEIVAFLAMLLPAGLDTTGNLLGNAMLALLDRPGDLARLRADPTLIPAFVEEVLRHDPPVHGIPRMTTKDVELGGVTVPAGSMILALIGSANRDEAQFPDPDRFDLGRETQTQAGIAFGHGVHFCLGVNLARMEGRIGVEALLSRFQAFSRAPGPITWNYSATVRGPTALPLRFHPA